MRRILLLTSLFGFCLFGGALALSLVNPLLIETVARQVVQLEIEHRVGVKVDTLAAARLAGFARRELRKIDADIAMSQQAIREALPVKVASVVAAMLKADCACRQRLIHDARTGEDERLRSLTQARERLVALIESAYASVAHELLREVRIFTASNALAFVMLGLVATGRRRAARQLLLPAAVLVGAVAITGGLYLFNQHWLHTILFGQYIGLAYCGYLAGVALLLADVVFNRARMTTRLVNMASSVVGGVASASPC